MTDTPPESDPVAPSNGDATDDLVSHPVPDAVREALGGSSRSPADPSADPPADPLADPAAGWTLRITTSTGVDLDSAPDQATDSEDDAGDSVTVTYDDLAALPHETFSGDFSCLEGWTATDLTWRGVRVGRLLEATVGARDGGSHALVRAMDGEYACAFPIDRLSESVLALELDGEPLPVEHGGPARLVPPGEDADCWRSVKWVAAIEVTAEPPTEADTAREIALSRVDG
ncbi:molybdopterin-dependent oxidoreductase [Halopenitus persicus]|uniref:molybdopterin-dependent oxidoreductase n=1 Tax=Halopenitus persicus TaxID=1048396 RepID=UPI000BBB3486|nr:molybdopterin-dependent oxidoreductase [Halopenitus persicus]